MARPVSVGRFERKLRAILGFSGSTLLHGVEDHVAGLIILEGDRPEWALAGGELLCAARIQAPGVAGEFAWASLRNPVDSGVLCIVTRVRIGTGGTGTDVRLQRKGFVFNTGFVSSFRDPDVSRDTRTGLTRLTTCQLARGGNAVQQMVLPNDALQNPGEIDLSGGNEYILGPGSSLVAESTAVAQQFALTCYWREVPLEASVLG